MCALKAEIANYIPGGGAGSVRLNVPDEGAGQRLDVVLASLLPEYSRSRLQTWVREGLVQVDGGVVFDPKQKLRGSEEILLNPATTASDDHGAEDIPLDIVYEDGHVLVVDKPAGLVVHPGNGNPSGTLLNALLHHVPELAQIPRAGIVHRLDKDTTGLLVVAKTLQAQTDLVRQLQARTVKRHYLALVLGVVGKGGIVDGPVGRHPVHRTRMAVVPGGKEARTRYEVQERLGNTTLIECVLDTGRTHQIRVHMASIGYPLVGDDTYGSRRKGDELLDSFPRQALHARQLGLIHPATGEIMTWSSPLPDDFSGLLTQLRNRQ